ncbi:uncharacterized protein LOC117299541 [Asterias rubens]|uniref:uncharacterized protein LOC117299541 n=1 Tax=Asterias rubens TaxID=7604 RepID=UPI001454F927|nr:uncharacterized protein LOC117299541 [Asterias rubens]
MANMYARVIAVTSVPPDQRADKDIELLLPWFKRKTELFSSLHNDVTKDIIKNCVFRRYGTDDVIIKQGDKGHSFFIVLNGSISVYIAADEDEPSTSTPSDDPEQPRTIRDELGTCVRSLGPGTSFGELALIDSGSIRKASVIADEPSDFIVVDRKLYSRSLKVAQKRDLEEKKEFIENHPLFDKWKARHKSILALSLRRKRALFGNRLVQQGAVVQNLHFILKGQAKVSISPWRQPNRMIIERDFEQRPATAINGTKTTETKTRSKSAANDMIIDVCTIGPGDIIGDLEVACDISAHVQTVTCLETVDTFLLDCDNFNKLVTSKKNTNTLDELRVAAKIKLTGRAYRAQNEPLISFLETLLKKITSGEPTPASQDDMRPDYWMIHRGPLIDKIGPGSLYHRVQMLNEKLRRKRERRERQKAVENPGESSSNELNKITDAKIKATIHPEFMSAFVAEQSERNEGTKAEISQISRVPSSPLEIKCKDERQESNGNQLGEKQKIHGVPQLFPTLPENKWATHRHPSTANSSSVQHFHRRSPSSTQVTIPANFLNQNHRRNISKSVTISRTESRTRWVRSAPATVSTSPNARRTPEDSDEVWQRQYSAAEYKGLKEKLRLQEKRHIRYLYSLW